MYVCVWVALSMSESRGQPAGVCSLSPCGSGDQTQVMLRLAASTFASSPYLQPLRWRERLRTATEKEENTRKSQLNPHQHAHISL